MTNSDELTDVDETVEFDIRIHDIANRFISLILPVSVSRFEVALNSMAIDIGRYAVKRLRTQSGVSISECEGVISEFFECIHLGHTTILSERINKLTAEVKQAHESTMNSKNHGHNALDTATEFSFNNLIAAGIDEIDAILGLLAVSVALYQSSTKQNIQSCIADIMLLLGDAGRKQIKQH